MANLKGSDFQKQIRDARIRTDKRGQKKAEMQGKNFARSHSIVYARESQLHDFANFLQNKGVNSGKEIESTFYRRKSPKFFQRKNFSTFCELCKYLYFRVQWAFKGIKKCKYYN